MRYGIIPTRLAERLALWLGLVPTPIADTLMPIIQTRCLMAAVQLGVFEAIGTSQSAALEIAEACKLNGDALDMLLRVLVSARYLEQIGNRYRLSAVAKRTLLAGAPLDSRAYVKFNYVQWQFVSRLEEMLKTGCGLDFHDHMKSQDWESYEMAMVDLARSAAPIVAGMVPVKGGARLLVDVGGSHGLLGAAICRRHPPMKSVVTELPAAVEQARAAAGRAGVTDVVSHVAADIRTQSIPGPADVVLFANVLHHLSVNESIAALRRAKESLAPGGTVAVWEFDRPREGSAADLAGDATALYFRLTSTSQIVAGDEYAEWLRAAGFEKVRLKRSVRAPVQVLALGLRK